MNYFKVILAFITLFSISLAQDQNSQADTSSRLFSPQEKYYFNLELGTFFSGSEQDRGWGNPFSANTSFGILVSPMVIVRANIDYYQYFVGGSVGEHSYLWSPGRGRRDDAALYGSVTFAGTLVAGAGAYYTKSDSVYLNYWLAGYKSPSSIGGFEEIRLFFIVGAILDFHLFDHVFLPVGLFIRQSYGDRFGPAFFRSGIQIRF
jgi:hypothetical protein